MMNGTLAFPQEDDTSDNRRAMSQSQEEKDTHNNLTSN
jgi:hypothetical protein